MQLSVHIFVIKLDYQLSDKTVKTLYPDMLHISETFTGNYYC